MDVKKRAIEIAKEAWPFKPKKLTKRQRFFKKARGLIFYLVFFLVIALLREQAQHGRINDFDFWGYLTSSLFVYFLFELIAFFYRKWKASRS